jgi:hypothetical protein
MIRKKIAAAAAAWFCAFPSHAIDALALEVGYGEDRTSWDFSAALWDNAVQSTADLGITPAVSLRTRRALPRGGDRLTPRADAHQRIARVQHRIPVRRPRRHRLAFRTLGLRRSPPGINFVLLRAQYELN